MSLGNFRKLRLLNLIVCLAFCLNLGFSGSAFALRPKSADKVEQAVLSLGIEMIRSLNAQGPGVLKAKLADLALDKVTDKVERELIANGIGVLQREGKAYIVSLIGNGWRVDISQDVIQIVRFSSKEERDAFISGGQLTWFAGEATPAQIIDAQAATKENLQRAGREKRIFTKDNLPAQVARYSAQRTSVERQLPPLATSEDPQKDEQKKLVARLQVAFDFLRKAMGSLTQADIDIMMPIGLPSDLPIKIGAEDFSIVDADLGGTAVGPINISHLREIGVTDSIVGHSAMRLTEIYERDTDGTFKLLRTQPGYTESDIVAKLKEALARNIKITLCVGETLKIREADKNAVGFVLKQLDDELGALNLTAEQVLGLLEAVAYEPLWAINTGVSAKSEQIQEMHAAIRKWFADKYGSELAEKIIIQYGGSVKVENAAGIFALQDVNGALIGGASLKADAFSKIAQIAEATGKHMLISANWKAEEATKRDVLEAHLKALAAVKLANTAVNYYIPFTLLTGARDVLAKARSPLLAGVKKDLEKVRQALVLDEENNPSFFYAGEPGSSRYLAVTLSSGGFKYEGYDFAKAGEKAPRSIYAILAMIESYMEMAKTDADALRAYGLKQLHDYFEVSGDSKFHREESQAVKDLINKYDKMAMDMWKQREAAKAKVKLERENKKVVLELTIANIAKFLDPQLEELIPAELIEAANQELQKLVESGLLTDSKLMVNAGDIAIVSTRQNKNAVENDALIPQALVSVFLKVLDKAKDMGIYAAGDLSNKSYPEQARALEIRRPYVPLKYTERAADPFGVFWASNTYVGAHNMLIWQILSDPMYNAGLTIDPEATRGYIFEVWDSVKDTVTRFDGETENNKLRALANQPGRYAIVAVYAKAEHKVPMDEPIITVSVKRMADDGKSPVGDFSAVLVVRAQSGLPAWGELIAPVGTAMPIITYGGDKTQRIVAWRPTSLEEANKITASRRKGLSLLVGFGFQSHDNGHFGITEDIGSHQTLAIARENAEKWAQTFYGSSLPKYMDHVTELQPFKTPHEYMRDDKVVKTRERLNDRFKENPDLKGGKSDPLLQKHGDYAISTIKADIGSVPGHYKPHRVTIRALNEILEIARSYGFKGVNQFINLTRAVTILRTGYTIDELVSKNGFYRKTDGGSDLLMSKVNEFRQKTKITNWDEALAYLKGKTKDESLINVVMSLKDAQIDYGEFAGKVTADSMVDALNYFAMSEEKASAGRLEVLSIMDGLTAASAKNIFDTNEAIRRALGLTTDLAEDEKILDFKVWAAGDDCQLTMKHKRLAEDKLMHTLAWDALWYAADQTSYFKPYGWKQDILVDRLVSGNIQGAGPGYAEVQVMEGDDVLAFSADKSAPGAFTVPILGITRKARAERRFPNGFFYEVWDINNRPRGFFYSEFEQDMADMLTLLSSPEEFAIKRVWGLKQKWDGKEPIEDVIDDIPLISASTERLVLTAGAYVGKDDPTLLVRITKGGFTTEEVINIFQYPQVTLGFMRGSHIGSLVPGTLPSFLFGKDKPSEFKPEATPHLFDGPPPLAGLVLVGAKPLNEAKDAFADAPWLNDAIKQGNFITQVLRRQGAFPPHKVDGAETEYTSVPAVMEAIEAEGRAKPGDNKQEEQFLKSLLALQSKGVSHKLNDAVIGVARDAANRKVVLISASVLRSDPSLILALQSINEQINQNLGVFGSSANIEANAYRFVLVADEPALRTAQDVEDLLAEIAKVTHNGAKGSKDIFAKILVQNDDRSEEERAKDTTIVGMYDGVITNAVDLLKQLERMGISQDLLAGLVGPNAWVNSIDEQQGLTSNAVKGNTDAERDKIAFAANVLFGVVEAIATADRKIPDSLAKKLELVQQATSISVTSKEIDTAIADEIEAYRERIIEV